MIHVRTPGEPRTTAETMSRLELGATDNVRVHVTLVPYLSAFMTAMTAPRDAAPHSTASRETEPSEDEGSARSHADTETVRPILDAHAHTVPDCLIGTPPLHDLWMQTHLDALHELTPDTLLAELAPTPAAPWEAVAERPSQWLKEFVDLVADTAHWMEPLWTSARAHLISECERLGAAVLRGATLPAVATTHPHIRVQDTALLLPGSGDSHELGGRGLILAPMIAPTGSLVYSLDNEDAVWIGYPIAEPETVQTQTGIGSATCPTGALRHLLGPVRAAILTALRHPATMGTLAQRVGHKPSAVTYHCELLEKAGLVRRVRTGPEVHARLTERGTALLALLNE